MVEINRNTWWQGQRQPVQTHERPRLMGSSRIKGADTDDNNLHDGEPQRGRGRSKLSPQLQIPKNRSTGNLGAVSEVAVPEPSTSRIRFSFDAGSIANADYDSVARSSIVAEHEHGLGLSGLRRIRQHYPMRTPTLPSSAASSRSPSTSLARSSSMVMLHPGHQIPLSPGPTSPSFTEDLSRFPSESLHSFSFAHQSEDFIQNRQNVLKRSIEFMKDRMGWAVSSDAAIASAQARVSGDVETQTMLEMLARAQLVGAGNLPHTDSSAFLGPLTGPAEVSPGNIFDRNFVPRTSSPDSYSTPRVSPTTLRSPEFQEKPIGNIPRSDGITPIRTTQLEAISDGPELELSPRAIADDSERAGKTSPPALIKPTLKRTFTDVASMSLEQKLMDTIAQPFGSIQQGVYPDVLISPTLLPQSGPSSFVPSSLGPAVHGHSARWVPAAQAIFTTESKPPWTILAANDLACLVFGVTKAEVRKMGILEVVQEERRAWLENKLQGTGTDEVGQSPAKKEVAKPAPVSSGSALLGGRGGITAQLLSKPNSRSQPPKAPVRRAQTVHSGDATPSKPRGGEHHTSTKSRGVLLCGDVVPIQKRNGATGSASLWVKEKRVGLIWVLEEIHEDAALVDLDDDGIVTKISGETGGIWGADAVRPGMDVGKLITRIPRQGIDPRYGAIDYAQIAKRKYFTCPNSGKTNIPVTVTQTRGQTELRVSSFPHIAGIIVVATDSLKIKSSNSVFCGALFGYEKPDGLSINSLISDFDKILKILTDQEGVDLHDGIVIPEHSFRKAAAFFALREGRPEAATNFLTPDGLPAKHRDGTELKIDVQMRVVQSEKHSGHDSGTSDDDTSSTEEAISNTESEMVFALWITYSKHLQVARRNTIIPSSPHLSGTETPLHQPSPGQTPAHTPLDISSDSDEPRRLSAAAAITKQLKDVAKSAAAKLTGSVVSEDKQTQPTPKVVEPPKGKKTIDDFVILEDMGQGAYGQVKLARYKYNGGRKVVLKYVTKRRILVDTWTRDRRLGTIPLEIHVLNYLRRDDLKHPNIVEMVDFFEDETNYYIEMAPHGLPGMDLFDYIELRTNMEEDECRSIFVQVAKAIHHLHTKANVVHRDIKDENVILDGEGNIKLIDFGSAAYIKSGPFDVFVGTIDYAAPEVLAGKPYGGKEQDVWALGILLYTIIYKENPFYSIDEIMDRDLRVPYTISDESIDLIRCMLNRDVSQRYDITQVLEHPWCQVDDDEE
ncbi:serine/threonine-protein kinase ppk6 [Xylariales sp. PMI_506]|nr:serine/threonine-protein kinase ppk6 [Xylariales sp. PMI_506]